MSRNFDYAIDCVSLSLHSAEDRPTATRLFLALLHLTPSHLAPSSSPPQSALHDPRIGHSWASNPAQLVPHQKPTLLHMLPYIEQPVSRVKEAHE